MYTCLISAYVKQILKKQTDLRDGQTQKNTTKHARFCFNDFSVMMARKRRLKTEYSLNIVDPNGICH